MTIPFRTRFSMLPIAALLTVAVVGCGGGADTDADAGEAMESAMPAETPAERRVEIVSPADGATLDQGPVVVRLEAHGFAVVPAGDTTPNSGHHHLFLDRDVSAAGQPIPAEEGFIVHMGTGVSEYTFQNVAPGEHRLIAVVGDAVHVPLDPMLTDTVRFTVR